MADSVMSLKQFHHLDSLNHSFQSKEKMNQKREKRHSCNERKMITWSFLCLIFFLFNPILVFASPARHLCRQDQKDALWEFKNEFSDQESYYIQTNRWTNNTDYCSWEGISCDPKMGNVVALDLMEGSLSGPLRSNSSLFKLQHLQSLNLSVNNFSGILPDTIENLKYLRVLRLGRCSFFGNVPSSLGNLSYLTDLRLSKNGFTGELPHSIGNLNRLQIMQFGWNNLSGNFPLMLLNLSELTHINLGENQLKGTLPFNMSSLSKLIYFVISGNSFSGPIPSFLFTISSLMGLELERNDFSGPLETVNISSPSQLEVLSLGENSFNGPFPRFISKLTGLIELDLSFWNTERDMIDFNIFLHLKSLVKLNLAYLNTRTKVDLSLFSHLMSLILLNLSGNKVIFHSTLHLHSPIEVLSLSSCSITEFPMFLHTRTDLSYLDISVNQIEGQVPEWLWRLPLLGEVNISQNFFRGFEGPADVIKKSGVVKLDISSNTFQDLPFLPTSLWFFSASDNQFSGEIPRTICQLVDLQNLVLSNNNFSGSIPRCFENFNTSLWILHLRNNNLSGVFPEISITANLKSLDVGQNRLLGKLPKSLINCTQLEFLNVEDNNIKDTFPSWLSLLPELQILVLRSNEFHGPISSPLSFLKLRIFDISENHFTGELPSDYFASWSAMSSVVDSVYIDPVIYDVNPSDHYHKSVGLTNKGSYMEILGSGFTIYKTIDVSRNKFEGNIPESISLLKELIVLNMSNNAFTGCIPPSLSNLTNLQSLDLSQNALSGQIPPELGKLTFLAWMNFSYNKLEGPIPQDTQIQSQNISSFAENPGLCGIPLQETCGGKKEETTKHEQEEEENEQGLSWIAAAIAYVPGVFCGLTIGHILNFYKHDWFMNFMLQR